MTIDYRVVIKLTLVIFILSLPSQGQSQVDPEWLKSWQQAVAMRPENVSSGSVLVSPNEPGIRMIINGQLFKPDGREVAKHTLIHLYHRDHAGFDFGENDNELTTWRLQAWAETNAEGKFEFYTVRPSPDHLGREGGHFHFTVVSEEFGKQWMKKVHFSDDPTITVEEKQRSAAQDPFSWIKEVTTQAGTQHIDLAFKLKEQTDF